MKKNTLENLLLPQERKTLAESVYLDIKQLLRYGRIPAGEKVTLRGLAKVLGTSPMPVREAVVRLVNEGALEMLPNRSLRVYKPRLSEFLEIVKIRCCLEGYAAHEAAANLTHTKIEQIEFYADEYDRLAKDKDSDPIEIIEANRLLHFTLYEAAEMPRLIAMIENIWTQIGSMFALSMNREERDVNNWESLQHHKLLIKALWEKDANAARNAIVSDITDASIYIHSTAELDN